MDFVRVRSKDWCLAQTINRRRRQQLLQGRGFNSIVRGIVKQASILTHKRARIEKFPEYYRAEITLHLNAKIVDLFHNSAAGYRAQYYHSTRTGKAANSYTLSKLRPRVIDLLVKVHKRTCPLWWVEKSLQLPQAKAWIHQGRWIRSAKKVDRNLMVNRWLKANPSEGKRVLWATLTPATETRIDLKGAPLTLAGKPLPVRLKPRRSMDIHKVGYT
jgi:hypothetical protein